MTSVLLIITGIYAVIFAAGRAHSRYLDRLEARRDGRDESVEITYTLEVDTTESEKEAKDQFPSLDQEFPTDSQKQQGPKSKQLVATGTYGISR
jgi:hypothetical protein